MISLAIPSSCISVHTCYSLEQATFALYQICRACVLYKVDEIIVFQVPEPLDQAEQLKQQKMKKLTFDEEEKPHVKQPSWETITAANMLQYFLTPRHLHKLVFVSQKPFKYARKLPRVLLPNKKVNERLIQGIAIKKHTNKKKGKKSKKEKQDAKLTPYVNFGFDRAFVVEQEIPLHSRVIVDLETKKLVDDVNCGYAVRAVDTFSKIFTECTVPDGYTHTYYVPCQSFFGKSDPALEPVTAVPAQARALFVLAKWQEIEDAVQQDSELEAQATDLFDGIFKGTNSCRLEDAVTVTLASKYPLDQ